MNLNFTKMQSLGNDFVVVNNTNQSIDLQPEQAIRLADRHVGIGCDQILLAETAEHPENDFKFRIFNADGSEVAQYGNGARCLGRFLRDQALTDKDRIQIETLNNRMVLLLRADGSVKVEMGIPEFEPELIPFRTTARQTTYSLSLGANTIDIFAVAIGNPHAVQLVDDVDHTAVETTGALLESHSSFPARVNAGFMQLVSSERIKLRVYERGVGETRACGSGACAAAVAGIALGHLGPHVQVALPGGEVTVSWRGAGEPVFLSGPAHTTFTGTITID